MHVYFFCLFWYDPYVIESITGSTLMDQRISILKVSQGLRDGYSNISQCDRELNYLDIQLNDQRLIFDPDYDMVLVDNGRAMIFGTDNGRYYVRLCRDNPKYSNCPSGICLEPSCQIGAYFDSFESALTAAIEWKSVPIERLPLHHSHPKMIHGHY